MIPVKASRIFSGYIRESLLTSFKTLNDHQLISVMDMLHRNKPVISEMSKRVGTIVNEFATQATGNSKAMNKFSRCDL